MSDRGRGRGGRGGDRGGRGGGNDRGGGRGQGGRGGGNDRGGGRGQGGRGGGNDRGGGRGQGGRGGGNDRGGGRGQGGRGGFGDAGNGNRGRGDGNFNYRERGGGGGNDRGAGRGYGDQRGGGNRGRGDFGRGDGRGRGGGRGKTIVKWEVRNPSCQQEEVLVLTQWKPFDENSKDPIALPPRKTEKPGMVTHFREIPLCLNHFEVEINFPKNLYQYRIDIERVKRDGEDSKKGPKPKPKGNGKSGPDQGPRLLPKDLLKGILLYLIPKLQRDFGLEYGIITDYSTNIYCVKRLEEKGIPLDMQIQGRDLQDRLPEEDGSSFKIVIRQTEERIDLSNLQFDVNNMKGQIIRENMTDIERIYSTLIRCLYNSSYTPMKRTGLIDFTQAPHPLGGGVVSYAGYHGMLPIATGWKKFVNIELANMASYVDGNVFNLLEDLQWRPPENIYDVTTWNSQHLEKASGLLRTCRITYRPGPGKTFTKGVVRVCRESVSQLTFQSDAGRVTVADYFRRTYQIQLRYPNGPCLECHGKNAPKIPAEICVIKKGQSYNRKLDDNQVTEIAKVARLQPKDLQPAISSAVQQLGMENNPIWKAYGLSLVTGEMHKLNARVLTPPELCYGKNPGVAGDGPNAVIVPENGEWDIWSTNFEFFRNCTIKKWGIFNLCARERHPYAVTADQAFEFANRLAEKAQCRGIDMDPKPFYEEPNGFLREDQHMENRRKFAAVFQRFRKGIADFVLKQTFLLVILPKKGSSMYQQVKQAAELDIGILTQCVVGRNISGQGRLDSICGNLMIKINSKLTAVNHVVLPPPNFQECFKVFNNPTMIIGADVTHPPPGSTRIVKNRDGTEREVGPPSFAAITASIDRTGMPYMMHIQAQQKAQNGAAEVVEKLDIVVKKFLEQFYERTRGVKPCRLIYYRDGVGEGQFQEVLRTEMSAIRRACTDLNPEYTPTITFVTVQKRHKTRFFYPSNGTYENAPPGTVVDSDIVHPVETDFYLLSHKGLLGTSRPTRYHILWDDADFSMGEIQILSYFLCYMFVRCNRSVKIPAPTYYAHWAAKRAEVLAKGACEGMYGNVEKINNYLNGGMREEFTNNFPMHFV